MTRSRVRTIAALVVVLGGTVAACSRPDPNPAIRVTGDPLAADPPTTVTTTTTTEAPTTTLYWSAERAAEQATDTNG